MTAIVVVACWFPLAPVTVTVYVPGLVAVLVGPDGFEGVGGFCCILFPLLPHPLAAAMMMAVNSRHIIVCHLRRGTGIKNRTRAAATPPPRPSGPRFCQLSIAVVAPFVLTVSVALTACVPAIICGWLMEHVGGLTAPTGAVTAQTRATLPVNPPLGVIVITEVAFPPTDGMLMFEPPSMNIGVAVGPAIVT
jgi:hypothetical protein